LKRDQGEVNGYAAAGIAKNSHEAASGLRRAAKDRFFLNVQKGRNRHVPVKQADDMVVGLIGKKDRAGLNHRQ